VRTPSPLPEALTTPASFSVADARALGVSRGRLGRGGLERPFHGVRAHGPLVSLEQRCEAYRSRMRPGQFFSHATAAALHGLPLPPGLQRDRRLHVSVLDPQQPPRARGVVGHRLGREPLELVEVGPFPAVPAIEAWCELGGVLDVPALVVAGDHLVRHGVTDPTAVLAGMATAVHRIRRTGASRLLAALELIRPGVRSPMESLLRVVIVQAGLQEPEVNVPLFGRDGRFLGEGDLVYRSGRLILEYEGAGHLVDERQFRKDIRRREDFEDEGWSVLRVTVEDLFPYRSRLLARIEHRLATPSRMQKRAL
jgi:hypothetical protein